MKTGGYWASRGEQKPVGRQGPPSSYYLTWLAILKDERGRHELTPYYFVSEDLCRLSPLLALAAQIPPSLHGFSSNFHRYNHAAMLINRFGHWIITCYERNFNESFINGLDSHFAKVVYLQGKPSPDVLSLLGRFRVGPLMICERDDALAACVAAGFRAWMLDEVQPASLMAEVGKLFSTPLEDLRNLGFTDDEMLPVRLVLEHPGSHSFGESHLAQYPAVSLRFLEPNETLINVIRRRTRPAAPEKAPPRRESVKLILDSCESTFAHLLADYLLFQESDEPDPTVELDLRDALKSYVSSSNSEDYERFVAKARDYLGTYPGAQSFILCCPAIHKESTESLLQTAVPNRILKYLFRKQGEDYLGWIDTRDLKSQEDQMMFWGLMQYAAMENAYLSSVLGLYALAARWPVIRTPQLSSALFGRLRQIHQAHEAGSARAVNTHIRAFNVELRKEIPSEIVDFVATHAGPHLKVFSDLPLEWLMIDGVPLMFQRELSRVPLRPGNGLLIHFDESKDTLRFTRSDVEDVLIIDCTEKHDEIGEYALRLHNVLKEVGFRSRFHRVATTEDYKRVLTREAPHVLVHWGHGSYDTRKDRGYLHVGREKTEVWDWKNIAVPPIVMLGACETSALARTHNNPSNAWLALGARSVLATLLPVQADLTCTLFTRIFANLLEAVSGDQFLSTWSVVVSKTLILQRYLDFFYGYKAWRSKKGLPAVPSEFFYEYPYRWNKTVTSLPDGYLRCTDTMREALAFFGDEFAVTFDRYLKLETVMPHTMFFTHLGSPETISLVKETREEYPGTPAREYWRRRDSAVS